MCKHVACRARALLPQNCAIPTNTKRYTPSKNMLETNQASSPQHLWQSISFHGCPAVQSGLLQQLA
jgi:hypothetical protein